MAVPHSSLGRRRPFEWRAVVSSPSTVRNYRLYFFGQLVSVAGTWMQTVAQSFLVLRLTGSGTALGLATAARFLPMFVFGPLGGLVADRMNKRRVLYVTQTLSGLLAGCLRRADRHRRHRDVDGLPAGPRPRASSTSSIIRPDRASSPRWSAPEDLSNAVTLNSVSLNMARVFGAALGGVFVAALGLAACFAINAVSFVAVLISLAMMRSADLYPSRRVAKEKGQVRAGFRYVRRTPELMVPLVMIAVIGTLAWEFQVTLPADGPRHLPPGRRHLRPHGLGDGRGGRDRGSDRGLPAKPTGPGPVGGRDRVGRRHPRRRRWPRRLPLELAALVFVGYGSITFNSMAKTTLQLAAIPVMRGRVMALWALAWLGSTPIGGPIVGWVGQTFGARWSLLIGGLPTVLIGLMAWPALKRIDHQSGVLASPIARLPSMVAPSPSEMALGPGRHAGEGVEVPGVATGST